MLRPPSPSWRPLALSALATLLALAARSDPAQEAGAGPAGDPRIPGLAADHGLDERQVGRVLLTELSCAACHTLEGVATRPAPGLEEVGSRVDPRWLEAFLADPRALRPRTLMPDLLGALPEGERSRAAGELAAFLRSRAGAPFERAELDPELAAQGEGLFHTIGCVACHAPRVAAAQTTGGVPGRPGDPGLEHVPAKYGRRSLATFLFQPHAARPSGRMPDLQLTRTEADAIACYLLGEGSEPALKGEASPQLDPEQVRAGAEWFERLNCAACHALPGFTPAPRRALTSLEAGCLDTAGATGPDQGLSATERGALRTALAPGAAASDLSGQLDEELARFNCVTCHSRGDHGGVPRAIDAYFTTDQFELGDEARIPPPLTDAGAKLKPTWLERVLYDGASVRAYMKTRMPRFGKGNIGHLVDLFDAVDAHAPLEPARPEGERRDAYRDAGRHLLGNRGAACVMCHDFNGKPGPVHRGLDLLTSVERLEYAWFRDFLVDPQAKRPGIVMPESWTDGVSAHTTTLEGDTEAQLEAIWYFLTLGTSARDPEGIASKPSRLVVTDRPRLYRGRSRIAGFRGVAVGFPGGLAYAFDARDGALAGVWQGDWLRVRWDGQGAGDFQPDARPVELAHDLAFHRLTSLDEPWPRSPVTTEEAPVNPDPTYPRQHGYRWRGYYFDPGGVPTLMYASGAVTIEDRTESVQEGERRLLRRTLSFEAPAAETLYFRALAGDLVEADGAFEVGRLRVTLPEVTTHLRAIPGAEGQRELLVELQLPAGTSTLTIDHELLR